jgi:hypothetical protein
MSLVNKVVRTINDYINQQFRILRNVELRVKCRPPTTVRIVRSGRLLLAEHAARIRKAKNAYRVYWH